MARICIDCRFFGGWSGGLGRYVQELVKNIALLDRKNEYLLLFTAQNSGELSRLPSNKMKKVVVNAPYYSLREQLVLPRVLHSLRPDLVHFTHFNHPVRYRGRFIITLHDLTLFQYGGRSPAGPIKQAAFRAVMNDAALRAERIITSCNTTAQEVSHLFSVPRERMVTIPIAIDEHYDRKIIKQRAAISEVKKRYAITSPYVIYVGQFRPHKNLSILLASFRILRKKHPTLSLVLVGGSLNHLQQMVNADDLLVVQDALQLPGFVSDEDLPYLIAGAELFIWPSVSEGFGLPPLEAMAVGIPVVSSHASCMPEVLGEAALYFDPHDVADLTAKIQQCLKNKSLRTELVGRGYRQAALYSWVDMAAKTLELYRSVLAD